MSNKDLSEKMNEIGELRNKVQKLKDYIAQQNASKNIRFTSGANSIDFKDSEFNNNFLNSIAESIIDQLNAKIEDLNSKLNND